jgi:ABC-2 type transport system permease protein
MHELMLVLNVKAGRFLKSVLDFRTQSLLKNLSSLLIFGMVAIGVFFLARGATLYMIQQANIGQFLYHRFLSMLFYVFFVTVNLGNMIVCYATLYKSEEVTFLMGLPLSHEKVFLLKFVDNFFYSSSTLTLLGLSWLLGYGSCYDMPWYFYFAAIFLVFLPFMLISALLAVLFLMGLIKIAARIGIRWLLAALAMVYLSVIYAYFKITNPVQLAEDVMRYYPNVDQYFGFLDSPVAKFLPNHWVSEFLYWSVMGEPARALPWFFILILVLLGMVIVSAFLARRYYYPSWLAVSDARAMRGPAGRGIRPALLTLGESRVLSPQTDAFVKRDLWLFLRDPSQWLHLVLILVLMLVFLVSLGSLELRLKQPLLQVSSFLVVFLFNGFLVSSVLLRFVYPAVSLEGEAFWSVRSAPVSLRRLYVYKLTFSLAGALLVSEVLAIASVILLREDPVLLRLSVGGMAFVTLGLTGLYLGAGSYFATFREKNPIRVASSQGASLTFLMSMVFLAVSASVLVTPLKRYFDLLIIRGVSTSDWIYLPLGVIALFSILVFSVSTAVGVRAIQRDF